MKTHHIFKSHTELPIEARFNSVRPRQVTTVGALGKSRRITAINDAIDKSVGNALNIARKENRAEKQRNERKAKRK